MSEADSHNALGALKQYDAFSHALFERSGGAFFILDEEGEILMVNGEAASLTGYSPKELSAFPLQKILPEGMGEIFMDQHARLFRDGVSSVDYKLCFVSRHGEAKEAVVTESEIPDSRHVILSAWCTGKKHELKDSLKLQMTVFQQFLANSPLATCMVDTLGAVIFVNEGFTRLFGFHFHEMKEGGGEVLYPQDHKKSEVRYLHSVLAEKTVQVETTRRHKNDVLIPVSITGYPLVIGGENLGGVFVYTDISERKSYEAELTRQALHDTLTQLPNRALFMERLDYFLMRCHRDPSKGTAVFMVDLDRFKLVNDSLGHLTGDALLVRVARRLENCLRPLDTVARLGGDEFGVILDTYDDKQDVVRIAKRIIGEIAKPIVIGSNRVYSGASVGIVFVNGAYGRSDDILRDADIAMYRAKSLGRGRLKVFSKNMHENAVETMSLENDIRQGIANDEFFVAYQPIISLESGGITGVEALARWDHPLKGSIPPARFIPLAEESGLIVSLGKTILNRACEDMVRWRKLSPQSAPLLLSVNMSPKQFVQPDLVDSVTYILAKTGLPPEYLKLEITESVIMDNAKEVVTKLELFRKMGIKFSIDDFGTGYSSMGYLQKFPVDQLKIDLSFVRDMHMNNDNQEIVRAIIRLAHSLRLNVVAEGVEQSVHKELLSSMQCDFGQGYFFSRPVSAEAIQVLLEESD
ncbi:EAL domain-containing protein [Desulfoplanes sp.]